MSKENQKTGGCGLGGSRVTVKLREEKMIVGCLQSPWIHGVRLTRSCDDR